VNPRLAKKASTSARPGLLDVKKYISMVLTPPVIIKVFMKTFLRPVLSAIAPRYGLRILMVKNDAAIT
jgi:hypothetical protein